MLKRLFQLAVIALTIPAFAQTPQMANAVTICPEQCVVTKVSSATALFQFGTGTTWGPTFTKPALPLNVNYYPPNLALSPYDPLPGAQKELDAQQQAKAYTVTWTLNGVNLTTAIPALAVAKLPPVLAPPPPPTVTATYTCKINVMSDGTFKSTTCAVTK